MESKRLSEEEINQNICTKVKSAEDANNKEIAINIDEDLSRHTNNVDDNITPSYEDPTMIFTKSRVTIGLLGLVILTLSTMMIFVILSVRIDSRIMESEPEYVLSKSKY